MAQRARCAGAPTASGPTGCSARAAYQPPWVAASKASNGRRPEPGVRWSTAACTPPHGSSGVTGASLPRARATPGVGEVGERVGGRAPARRPAARRTCRRRRPRPRRRPAARWRPSPGRASARRRRRSTISTCSSRCRQARTAAAPELGDHGARPRRSPGRRRRRRCTWKPAWTPASVQARTWWTELPGVEAQGAGGVRPVGVGPSPSAAVCEPKAPSQNRSPPAPARPSSRTTSRPPRSASSPQ